MEVDHYNAFMASEINQPLGGSMSLAATLESLGFQSWQVLAVVDTWKSMYENNSHVYKAVQFTLDRAMSAGVINSHDRDDVEDALWDSLNQGV